MNNKIFNQFGEQLNDLSSRIKNGVLKSGDCGIVPNTGKNVSYSLRSFLYTAAVYGAEALMEPGDYRVTPALEGIGEYVFDFSNYSFDSVRINGNKACLICDDSYAGFFHFKNSTNIFIEGFDFDYSCVPWLQGEITAINPENQEITVLFDNECSVIDDERFPKSISTIFGVARDNLNPLLIKKDMQNFFRYDSHLKLGERLYRIKLGSETPFVGRFLQENDKIILTNRGTANGAIFDVRMCGSVSVKDITVFAQYGCTLVGHYMYGPVSLEEVRVLYKPGTGRWSTGNSDGVHIQAGTHPITIKNCVFEGLSDDGVNLYQVHSIVKQIIDENRILVEGDSEYITRIPKKGQEIELFNARTGKYAGRTTVKEFETIEGKDDSFHGILTLDMSTNELTAGDKRTDADIIFIKDYAMNKSVISNSVFRNLRGRGIVNRTNSFTVEDCHFEEISNHAIHMTFWLFEGLASSGVKIRNNVFTGCGYNKIESNAADAGVIAVRIETCDTVTRGEGLLHEDINISCNKFINYHGRAILLSNGKRFDINKNDFINDDDLEYSENNDAIYISVAHDVVISENNFHDMRNGNVAGIKYEKENVQNIKIKDNLFTMLPEKEVAIV